MTNLLSERWEALAPHWRRMVAVARLRGVSAEDARDIAAEVMEAAALDPSVDLTDPGPYLRTAVRNRCASLGQRSARRSEILHRMYGDDRLVGPVDEVVCDRDHARWLGAQVEALPARNREVFMRRVEGESPEAIARAMGLSYPTVNRVLTQTRSTLRKAALLAFVGFAWRQRRVARPALASVAFATIAAVALVGTSPAQPTREGVTRRPTTAAAVVRSRPAAVPVVRSRPVRPPSKPQARAAAAQSPVPRTPAPARRDVADAGPVNVYFNDDEALTDRARKCLRNGVHVEAQVGGRIGVTCRESGTPAGDLIGVTS